MNMEGGGAYGAGKTTGHFDCSAYVRKPHVILRAVGWVGRHYLTQLIQMTTLTRVAASLIQLLGRCSDARRCQIRLITSLH